MNMEHQMDTPEEQMVVLAESIESQSREIATRAPLAIQNEEQLKQGNNVMAELTDFLKTAENKRKELVKPLNDTVKKLNAWHKETVAVAVALNSTLRGMIMNYMLAQKKIAQAAQVAEMVKAVQTRAPMVVVEKPPTVVTTDSGATQLRDNWTWELATDKIAEVPPQYLSVNSAAITAAVKSGVREIAGIRIFNAPTVAYRRSQ